MSVKRISPEEAKALVDEGWTFVDVRSVPEFELGHPAGAYNVPLMHRGPSGMTPNPDFLAVMKRRFAPDQRLVVACRSGGRSLKAAELLTANGFTQVVDQRAGWDGVRDAFGGVTEPGWERAGMPCAMDAEPGRTWDELASDG